MRWTTLTLAALALATFPIQADDLEPKLNVGDKAPKFEVKEFIKGDAVKELAKGKVHVVEFWATWCGPCIATIPHLTELQKKHGDVTIVGVSVWEHDPKDAKPFVEKMGAKMNYRVAMDAVPEGKKGDDGAMAKNWMTAAGQQGIPTAFIVNRDGVIAWIGHPAELDKPLADVVANQWDIQAEIARVKEERVRERRFRTIVAKIEKAQENDDRKGVLTVIDAAIKDDPKMEELLAPTKFNTLLELKDVENVVTYGRRLVTDVYKDDASQLNDLAWSLVDPDADKKPGGKQIDSKLAKVAIEMAKRAADLTQHKDGGILDTLACAYYMDGDLAKAVETQEKAVQLQPDDDMKERLALFRKKLKDKDGGK
jgi:thiol-disulfide isomerase/thioredoxin